MRGAIKASSAESIHAASNLLSKKSIIGSVRSIVFAWPLVALVASGNDLWKLQVFSAQPSLALKL